MDTENQLIESYKRDFSVKVGKMIEIRVLDKWDELCYFDLQAPFWTIVQMILDATGWEAEKTFRKYRKAEIVSRRQIIDLIASNNGKKLLRIGRETARDHTTVMHSVASAKHLVETDMLYRKIVREVMDYIRENYEQYRNNTYTREEILGF